MKQTIKEIEEIVARETRAWDTQDVNLLLSIFHRDMVWPWPPSSQNHDPINWVLDFGHFDEKKWGSRWQELFDTHLLVHNFRKIEKIEVTEEQNGAFAVVDIDTLWVNRKTEERNHWKGRVCKVYTKTEEGWKLIMHTGVLEYPLIGNKIEMYGKVRL